MISVIFFYENLFFSTIQDQYDILSKKYNNIVTEMDGKKIDFEKFSVNGSIKDVFFCRSEISITKLMLFLCK